ncbi:MAG: MaoC family dehydratase [Paracoccaceae bacterium]|nr:MaoC family dehydratase [Paracoccaceae bacterium]
MGKASPGNFFEDFRLGQIIDHAVPRTVSGGERAVHHSLYLSRFALTSCDAFARSCGLPASPLDELAVFHMVFGRTVPDISLNAVANLGYADCRFLRPVWPGDSLRASSEVIGLRENTSGKTGIVWVRSSGINQNGETVIVFNRWVMVRKRDAGAPATAPTVPHLVEFVPPGRIPVPPGLDFTRYDFSQAGETYRHGDYETGEIIDHLDTVTIDESDHLAATRLWQNTARVHFDATIRPDGRRLIYGGHVISLARALSFNGLANAQLVAAINGGTHANPCFAGDTVRAWSVILDRTETRAPGVGALRIQLVAAKAGTEGTEVRNESGAYRPDILLDLDIWALIPV